MSWRAEAPPAQLIGADGQAQLGWWTQEPAAYALERLRLQRPMGGQWPKWTRFLRYKHWHFVSLVHEEFMLGLALVDLGYAHQVFVYVHEQGRTQADTWRGLPWPRRMHLATAPQGLSCYHGAGRIELRQADDGLHLKFDWPRLQLRGQLLLSGCEPLVLSLPAGACSWTYTVKRAALSVQGELQWRGRTWSTASMLASHDLSLGLMRRQTAWQWSSLATWIDGHRVGLNLAMGVNESGQNENAVWIDGRLHKLAAVFLRGQGEQGQAAGEGLELHFQGRDEHAEYLHTGLIDSRFCQRQGLYRGHLDAAGRRWPLDQVMGLWEDHYVKW